MTPAWLVQLDEEGVDGDVLEVSPPLGDEVALHRVQGEHQAPRLVHTLRLQRVLSLRPCEGLLILGPAIWSRIKERHDEILSSSDLADMLLYALVCSDMLL